MVQPDYAVCCIICAYNEAARVPAVIGLVRASGLFTRVLCVDDGSSDGTAEAARSAGAEVIVHPRNAGKAQAMLSGVKATAEPLICFLDADLLNVTPAHLRALVNPVVHGEAMATLGVFKGGRAATTLAQSIAPMISGQRCLRRDLLEGFTGWDARFGVETAINAHLKALGVEQLIVEWPGAAQVMKEEKRGFLRGFIARLGMYWDIFRAWLRSKRRSG